MNLPLRTAFAVSHRFGVVVFSFSFVAVFFFFFPSMTHSLFGSILFSLHVFVFFEAFFLVVDF